MRASPSFAALRPSVAARSQRRPAVTNRRHGRVPIAFRLACAFVLAIALAPHAAAHPLHTSSAQADYRRDTQSLEIGIRVFAEDLLAALNTGRTTPLSYEKTPPAELDTALRAYVQEKFLVRTADGAPVPLRWVGREFDRATPGHAADDHRHPDEQTLWLYVEASLPDGLEGIRLLHALLHERFRDQQNVIRVRDGPREATLAFSRDDRPKPIRFAK